MYVQEPETTMLDFPTIPKTFLTVLTAQMKIETILLRSRSWELRCSRRTTVPLRRRTAFHLVAISGTLDSGDFASEESSLRSPAPIK